MFMMVFIQIIKQHQPFLIKMDYFNQLMFALRSWHLSISFRPYLTIILATRELHVIMPVLPHIAFLMQFLQVWDQPSLFAPYTYTYIRVFIIVFQTKNLCSLKNVSHCPSSSKKLEFRYQLWLRKSNRHNKMETSVSEISLTSRIGPRTGCKGNTNASTSQTSKAYEYDSTMTNEEEDSIQQPDKTRKIQARITAVEQSQADLQAKFEKVIESLTKDIAKKDEVNAMLEAEICTLRGQLEESKKDLGIIVGYLAKRKTKAIEGESRKVLLNFTKVSGRLEKSVSGSKGDIDLTVVQPKEERKNRSPRMLILKKSFKG